MSGNWVPAAAISFLNASEIARVSLVVLGGKDVVLGAVQSHDVNGKRALMRANPKPIPFGTPVIMTISWQNAQTISATVHDIALEPFSLREPAGRLAFGGSAAEVTFEYVTFDCDIGKNDGAKP